MAEYLRDCHKSAVLKSCVRVYAACDCDRACQRALLAHQGVSCAQHLFGDLCDLAPRAVAEELRLELVRLRAKVEATGVQ
eukprot:6890435-Lingulodinium_polyedra.AAC.1